MRIATFLSAIITALLLLTTMICGLWLKSNNITDSGSLAFHMNSGIAAVVFSFITLILFGILLKQMKKKD